MSSRAKQGLPALLPVLRLLAQYKLRLAGASIALLFTAGATLSLGRGLQVLIDQGFGGESSGEKHQSRASRPGFHFTRPRAASLQKVFGHRLGKRCAAFVAHGGLVTQGVTR